MSCLVFWVVSFLFFVFVSFSFFPFFQVIMSWSIVVSKLFRGMVYKWNSVTKRAISFADITASYVTSNIKEKGIVKDVCYFPSTSSSVLFSIPVFCQLFLHGQSFGLSTAGFIFHQKRFFFSFRMNALKNCSVSLTVKWGISNLCYRIVQWKQSCTHSLATKSTDHVPDAVLERCGLGPHRAVVATECREAGASLNSIILFLFSPFLASSPPQGRLWK